MKFGLKWISWIYVCISNNSIFVLIKRSPTKDFKIEWRLCQGDSLLPFLFIITAEGITELLRNVCSSSCFSPFIVVENLSFELLQYIDDTIIMGKAYRENIWELESFLRVIELASDLSVNLHNSKILGLNVGSDFLQDASDFLSCAISPFPFNFLGIS